MSGGRTAWRERIRAARMRIVPGSVPLRSSGTTKLRQRAGRAAGHEAATAAGAGAVSAIEAATSRRMGAGVRSWMV
jgi:hypothetical protein